MSKQIALVVDDSRTIRLHIQQILSDAGFEVVTAEDGWQAIQQLEQVDPCVMVLDIVMPRLDGYGVCKELERFGPRFKKLPIVFLTSIESHAMELLGHEYGTYLKKPVGKKELLTAIASLLENLASNLEVQRVPS